MSSDFDFFDPDFQKNVHSEFDRMQKECPFAHTNKPFDWYAVTREEDVRELLADWKLWTSNSGPGLAHQGGGVLVSVDPPEHIFDRRLINQAFSPKSLLAMEDEIAELINRLIDDFVDKGEGDLMELFAVPVPLIVIARLLGLDEEMVLQMRPLADTVIHPDTPPGPVEPPPQDGPVFDYFNNMMDERRAAVAAGEEVPQNVLTTLVTAELDGRTLTNQEVLGFMFFLFIAGSQTTTQLIGNLIYRLLQFPDQMDKIRANPDLMMNAVEESLRFDAPVNGLFRTNTQDTTYKNVRLKKDTKVLCMFGAANRDPAFWDHPEKFDVERNYQDLKNHYAFGKGIHYCMGAPLARLEGKLALQYILERLPNLRLTGEPTEIPANVMHGCHTLAVAWDVPENN
jgi:cytochrome P450